MRCKGKNYVFIRNVPRGKVNIPMVVIFGMSSVFNIFPLQKRKAGSHGKNCFLPSPSFRNSFLKSVFVGARFSMPGDRGLLPRHLTAFQCWREPKLSSGTLSQLPQAAGEAPCLCDARAAGLPGPGREAGLPQRCRGAEHTGSGASRCNPTFISSGGTSPGDCPCSSGICGSLATCFQGETRNAVLPVPCTSIPLTAPLPHPLQLPHPSDQWEPGELGPIQKAQCCLTSKSLGALTHCLKSHLVAYSQNA